jgi:hypothetical protein
MCTFLNLVSRWRWVVNATPRLLYSRREAWYPFYRKLGGPQDRCKRVRKISPPPGFDPRTVHLVASRYTDLAIAAHLTDIGSMLHRNIDKWTVDVRMRGNISEEPNLCVFERYNRGL